MNLTRYFGFAGLFISTLLTQIAQAQYRVELQEPIGNQSSVSGANGIDLIIQYISYIYIYMAVLVGGVAVLMIIIGGLQITVGGASPEMVSNAKSRILQALLSLVLLFGTALLLKTVNPQFFG